MKDQKKTDIKVGILSLATIILFLLVLGWAKNLLLFKSEQVVMISFPTVAGLSEGDAVTVSGVKKGHVTEISLDRNFAIVKISIESDVQLKEDAVFSVMMLDLMGGKKIEIDPGISSNLIDLSRAHNGKFAGDIATAMSTLSSVQDDLIKVITEIKISLERINDSYLNPQFIAKISESVNELSRLTKNLNEIVKENREDINELLISGINLSRSVSDVLDSNKTALSNTINSVDSLIYNSNKLIVRFDNFVSEIKQKKNSLGEVIYNDKLLEDVKITIEQLKKLTEILIKQLEGEGVNVDAHIF